jgi:hypothetical protein
MQARQDALHHVSRELVRVSGPVRASRLGMKTPHSGMSLPEPDRVADDPGGSEGSMERLLGVVVTVPRDLDGALESVARGQVFPRARPRGNFEASLRKAARAIVVAASEPCTVTARANLLISALLAVLGQIHASSLTAAGEPSVAV